jgi:hypothetical protein
LAEVGAGIGVWPSEYIILKRDEADIRLCVFSHDRTMGGAQTSRLGRRASEVHGRKTVRKARYLRRLRVYDYNAQKRLVPCFRYRKSDCPEGMDFYTLVTKGPFFPDPSHIHGVRQWGYKHRY